MKELVERISFSNFDPNLKIYSNKQENSFIFYSVIKEHISVFRILLKENFSLLTEENSKSQTPLMFAIVHSKERIINEILTMKDYDEELLLRQPIR